MAAQALEQSVLESKDKTQLIQIAEALGVKANARSKKAEIIEQILAKTAGPAPAPAPATAPATAPAAPAPPAATPEPAAEPKAEWELALDAEVGTDADESPSAGTAASTASGTTSSATANLPSTRPAGGRDGGRDGQRSPRSPQRSQAPDGQSGPSGESDGSGDGFNDGESRNKRRRRRKKKQRDDGPQGEDREFVEGDEDQPVSNEPVQIEGYLDIRDEGYGFVRVNNYLASKSDAYIPVKLSKQYGLRKGDHVVATSRPAGRNEKNPPVLSISSVNGRSPEEARKRRRFEDLTALFPDSRLRMEDPSDPSNMTARIIDLVSPIGKGQRGIIVSPPKAGKTTVMKTIAQSIEKNNPECTLIVLLIDERPEEVTDMKRLVKGEVIASTFDKPSDQHTQIAELCIEKAKRLVEYGEDVVIILDGITRLSRAYNLAAPASGRILSGGIDAGALYPPKRFFGAARNVEEGGSLTILATALVETNSRMDEAVFEEFKGTGNMELRLDRRLAERRIYPAIDVDASSTRHEELLYDRKQLQMVWKLRRVLSGLAADGNAAPGLELLVDRLKTFRTNDEFLTEIAKQPGM